MLSAALLRSGVLFIEDGTLALDQLPQMLTPEVKLFAFDPGQLLLIQHQRGNRSHDGSAARGSSLLCMNSELEELYQEVILDHSRRPRNFGELLDPTVRVHGDNPACGDAIDLEQALRYGK